MIAIGHRIEVTTGAIQVATVEHCRRPEVSVHVELMRLEARIAPRTSNRNWPRLPAAACDDLDRQLVTTGTSVKVRIASVISSAVAFTVWVNTTKELP